MFCKIKPEAKAQGTGKISEEQDLRNVRTKVLALMAAASFIFVFAAPASGEEPATSKDFWKSAASIAPYTLYAVPNKTAKKLGYSPPGAPFEIEMLCKGILNFSADYRRRDNGGDISTYATSSPDCFPDFGVPGAPSAPISITAKGKKINLFYDGCLTTPTGGEDPTVEECIKDSRQNFDNDGNNVTYSGVVRLPVDGGKSATHMYIISSGLTVKQIRAFVRSLQTVS